VVVPLTHAQKDDIASLEKELIIELGAEGADLLDPSEEIVQAMSQATASGKISQIMQGFLYKDGQTVQTYGKAKLEALDDLLAAADGENIIIVYHYRHDLEMLRARLKGAEVLGSDTKDSDAVRIIDAWNRGEVQYLICHPASVGHGIQLQFGGRRMIWFAMTWSHELWVQMCKRIARPGQTQPVYVHRLLADHWYEKKRVERVESKMVEEAEFIQTLRRI
jgi:SNF2 family DNA or RNA helicase